MGRDRRQFSETGAEHSTETGAGAGVETGPSPAIRGTPASSGIGEGKAHILADSIGFDQIRQGRTENAERETERFRRALRETEAEITAQLQKTEGLSDHDQAILEVHTMFLRDRPFTEAVESRTMAGCSAESALKQVVSEYMHYFRSLEDGYLREREADVRNVGRWVLQHLMEARRPEERHFTEPTVVVAAYITPLKLEELRQPNLMGIVLTEGGVTSHTAILARSFEIPLVLDAGEAVERISEHDELIIDGNAGLVITGPPQEIRREYHRLQREKKREFSELAALRDEHPGTADGYTFRLGANIGFTTDIDLVHTYGADHVGLFRTEIPFLEREELPSEEEQTGMYRSITAHARDKPVTIRTLDVGGEKLFSSLERPKESNPYLGWRAIRLTLEHDHLFRSQLRAILRSAVSGPVRLLIPMVTSVEEVKSIVEIIREEQRELEARGAEYDPHIPVGIMVEVPAAVFALSKLLRYVDFVSVGLNDLTQYLLAADRNNRKVASLYSPLHPAVLNALRTVVDTCRRAGRPVSICGEAVSHPRFAGLLLAMEPDALSVYPSAVPLIKDRIRKTRVGKQKELLEQIMSCEDAGEAAELLRRAEQEG